MRPLARPLLALTLAAVVLGAPAAPAVAQQVDSAVPPPQIVPFDQWAGGSSCPTPTGADVAPTTRVVVHHSHHPVAETRDDVLPALREICDLHLARGFDTIGYHYVIDPWGTIYQARGTLPDADGRAPTAQPEGAHVHGSNPGAAGVVFLGDHEAEPPTAASVDAAVRLLAWLVEATGRDPGELVAVESSGGGTALHEGTVEIEALAGHNATNATLCPGQHLIELLEPIRERVRAVIVGDVGALVVADRVRPSWDGVAHVTSSGPILAAPPPEPPLHAGSGVLGLLPGATLALGLLHAAASSRRWRTTSGEPGPPDGCAAGT